MRGEYHNYKTVFTYIYIDIDMYKTWLGVAVTLSVSL